jgi:ATP-dependent helicase YprA (DUF1998 family)
LRSRYCHQARSVGAALRGHDVVVSTPTASGKSLCYTLPAIAAAVSATHRTLASTVRKTGVWAGRWGGARGCMTI